MAFFTSLNYSSCNEDGATELQALAIAPEDIVACISGSGDRPLHLLLGNPDQIFAFDANATQNYLLELKIAAIRFLEYEDFLAFLGVTEMSKSLRIDYLTTLVQHISTPAKEWFESRRNLIARGIIYAGRWERYFGMTAWILQRVRGKKIETLFSFTDLKKQRDFIRSEWNTPRWRLFLRLSFNPIFFRFVFGDPGFYSFVGSDSPGLYINDRMLDYLNQATARSSFMLALVFKGSFFHKDHYPLYLQRQHFNTLKNRVDRVTIIQAQLFEMLRSDEGEMCNKFSLSDVSSFLSTSQYEELFEHFSHRKNIRFCLRDFLTQRVAPQSEKTRISYCRDLEKECQRVDTSLGYTFIIGKTGL